MDAWGYRFGLFEVQLPASELRKEGLKVRLQDQPFRILVALLRQPGQVVTREELRRELWTAGTFVSFDNALNNAVNRLREALGDSAEQARFVETLPRQGYRFIAPVEELAAPARVGAAETAAPAPTGGFHLDKRVVMAGLGLLAVAVLAFAMVRPSSAPRAERVMLAVLPFVNLSGEAQDEYFSDGLTEEMIAQLGRLQPSRLGVIARTSAMRYRNTDKGVDQIGRDLGVDYVLEGGVGRAAGRVRVNARLIQVSDQAQVWSGSYERALADVLEVQATMARAIATEIHLHLTPEEQAWLGARRSVQPEGYSLYLEGRYHLNKRTEEGLRRGLERFQQALAIAPDHALAQAGLADAHLLLGAGDYSVHPPREAMPRAKAAAQRAVQLDGSRAEPHTTLAFIAFTYEWDWPVAEAAFRRALALDPNYATAHHWYALYLKALGRGDEALAEARRAQDLDPLSLIIGTDRAWALYHLRRYDEAVAQCERVLALDADFALARWNLGQALVQKGEAGRAVEEIEHALRLAGPSPVFQASLAEALSAAGRRAEAVHILSGLQAQATQRYVSPADLARVHVALGETDRAFALLEKAFDERSDFFVNLKVDPRLDRLRADPRFLRLLARVGLAADR
jgi:TolB-like protein/DNA-binding winged helix-turn-helix (wHTH) protein/Tfp pilus assembly protein PilF